MPSVTAIGEINRDHTFFECPVRSSGLLFEMLLSAHSPTAQSLPLRPPRRSGFFSQAVEHMHVSRREMQTREVVATPRRFWRTGPCRCNSLQLGTRRGRRSGKAVRVRLFRQVPWRHAIASRQLPLAKVIRMSSDWYRRIAEECLEVAADARTSEDADTWRLIAEEWFRIAADFETGEEPLAS